MDESSRLTKTKEQWAKARRGGEEREVFSRLRSSISFIRLS
jgi:hypothetical protein